MKIKFSRINPVRTKLTDGTKRTYYYFGRRKVAARLKGEPGSPEFLESYGRKLTNKLADDQITSKLIDDYLDSVRFRTCPAQ